MLQIAGGIIIAVFGLWLFGIIIALAYSLFLWLNEIFISLKDSTDSDSS